MVFVDGENLVARYQDMLKNGRTPATSTGSQHHERDIYVWHESSAPARQHFVTRAYYYLSVQGSDERLDQIGDALRKMPVVTPPLGLPTTLSPRVFKKRPGQAKAKAVDIQLTIDMLTHAYKNNYDTCHLMSGDGDFVPVVQEVQRTGKYVIVSAFSKGLNPAIPRVADQFISLDHLYFA